MCSINVFIPRGLPGWAGGPQHTVTDGEETCSGLSSELCQEASENMSGFSLYPGAAKILSSTDGWPAGRHLHSW